MKDLREIPFFSGLSERALAALHARMRVRRFRKGELVMREGTVGDSMFFVLSGQVQVLTEGRDGEPDTIVTHLGPGALVGEMGPLLGERRSATVRVVIDAELWELRKEDLDALFAEHPEIAISFSRELARELARRLTRTTRQPVERDTINLVAVLGSDIPQLAGSLAAVTGEQVMLLDLGGMRPHEPAIPDGVAVEQIDLASDPELLAGRLGQLVGQYGRVVMAIPRHENPLTRKAAEQAEVIIEMGGRATPWVKRFARDGTYWYHPVANGVVPSVARRIARKRVGLALSSGNARSIAHIGVLRVLEQENIPIDMLSGTSGGALFGGLYAVGKSVEEVATFARNLAKIFSIRSGLADFNIPPRTGIVRGNKVTKFLEKSFDAKRFEEAELPFRVIAADVITGEEVIFQSGSVAEAVRASISSVPLFDPAPVGGRWLIDGAAVNPVPASVLRDHVDIIVASSVIVSLEERVHRKAMKQSGRLPNIVGLTLGKEEIMEAGIIQNKLGHVDALIQPDVTLFEGLDFERADDFIRAGEEAAEHVVSALKSVLEPTPTRHFR